MKGSEIRIELDNPLRSYMAGETVKGLMVLEFAKPERFKALTITLDGCGKVYWHEWEQYTVNRRKESFWGNSQTVQEQRTRRITVSANETYINIQKSIALAGDEKYYRLYKAGVYKYNFKFDLPKNLPSSFASKKGNVCYTLEAKLKKAEAPSKLDKKASLELAVNGILDLNTKPAAKLPVDCVQVKCQNMLLGRKGRASFTLVVPERSGFVPGEGLYFEVEFCNESNKDIVKTTAWLQQDVEFLAQNKSRYKSLIVSYVNGPVVRKCNTQFWKCAMPIPPTPPTNLGGKCGIIRVKYFLHVKMNVEGLLAMGKSGKVPIIIGTTPLIGAIPLRPPMEELTTCSPLTSTVGAGEQERLSSEMSMDLITSKDTFQPYPDSPPPSYEEAVNTKKCKVNPKKDKCRQKKKGFFQKLSCC